MVLLCDLLEILISKSSAQIHKRFQDLSLSPFYPNKLVKPSFRQQYKEIWIANVFNKDMLF